MKPLLILALTVALGGSISFVRADLPPKPGTANQAGVEKVDTKKLLQNFDVDKDGKPDAKELSKALRSLKHNSLTSKMLPKYDKDGDGKLNLEELTRMLEDEK